MNRRQFATSSAALLASGTAFRGSDTAGQQGTPAASGDPSGERWHFTDDRGRTVTLPTMPTRIFADAAAGIALWELGITPVGLFGYPGLFPLPADLEGLPFVDFSSGQLDLEQVRAVEPELSVGQVWTSRDSNNFAAVDETTLTGFTDIAPTVGIQVVETPLDRSISRFEDLAAALGADLTTQAAMAKRGAFFAAVDAVHAAAIAKPGLKVMAFTPYEDSLWIGNPRAASDLALFANLGVRFVVPDSFGRRRADVFLPMSWEDIGSYDVDLYLRDDRSDTMTSQQLLEHPVFSLLPAAKAGQIGTWTVRFAPTFTRATGLLDALARSLHDAEVVTG